MDFSQDSTWFQAFSSVRNFKHPAEVGVKYYHFDPLCETEFFFSRREVKT